MAYKQKGFEAFTRNSSRTNIYNKPTEGSSPGKNIEEERLLTNREFASAIKNDAGFNAATSSSNNAKPGGPKPTTGTNTGATTFGKARTSNPANRTATNPVARSGGQTTNAQARMGLTSGSGRADVMQRLAQQKYKETLLDAREKQLDFRAPLEHTPDMTAIESPIVRGNRKKLPGGDAIAVNDSVSKQPINNVLGVNLHKSMA